jgi:hypothetical protein
VEIEQNCVLSGLLSAVPARVVLFLFNVFETNVPRKSLISEFSHSLGHQGTWRPSCGMSAYPQDRSGEPDRQVFAKFKHLSRKAAARSSETIYVTIGEILRGFTPTERATRYAPIPKSIML